MLNDVMVAQYLERIGYRGSTSLELSTLRGLHLAHMQYVPFENLDIFLSKPVSLSVDALFDKVVLKYRGGFCYELNTLFFELLTALGFQVHMLSAKVFNGSSYGPDFDHMLLTVAVNDKQVIMDVGFGDSFREPVFLDISHSIQLDSVYDVEQHGLNFILYRRKIGMARSPQYGFTLNTHQVLAFHTMCVFQQTSPKSHFTQKSVCSIATKYGRKTISNGRFIISGKNKRTEYIIGSESEYREILRKNFKIALSEDCCLARLMAK
ncbi:arylamine N-acetyltransferase family protein [Undibacterium sp. RuTC16W]|uniref:arylamine N-acetyltransferase family protein n=1 Tax=Undibacterium sp. RuTC16W TaxID=3413048 RepID=UPI003BF28C68